MKLNKSKKTFILITTYIIFLFVPKLKSNKQVNYNEEYVYSSTIPYASYSNGNVYIASEELINKMNKDDNDIYIIDTRHSKNSDMAICDSYKITSNKEMEEIIDIMLNYEETYPSNWNRTMESMKNEWDIHNICYFLGINKVSSEKVDFDNNDQEKYKSKILSFFLNN